MVLICLVSVFVECFSKDLVEDMYCFMRLDYLNFNEYYVVCVFIGYIIYIVIGYVEVLMLKFCVKICGVLYLIGKCILVVVYYFFVIIWIGFVMFGVVYYMMVGFFRIFVVDWILVSFIVFVSYYG